MIDEVLEANEKTNGWGCVVLIVIVVICVTAYQIVDRVVPPKPVNETIATQK